MPVLTREEIENRGTYHPPTEEAKKRHEDIREMYIETADHMRESYPDCRELSVAYTKLEEWMFWMNACVARNHDKF